MKKWMKEAVLLLGAALLTVSAAGCSLGDGSSSEKESGIQSAAELTAQSQVAMPEPQEAEEAAYEIVEEGTAQIRYKTGETDYTFRGSKSKDWKIISGSTEEFVGDPAVRIIKCNGEKSQLQAYHSPEGSRAGYWVWNDVTYVLLTETNIEEDIFIEECLSLVKESYLIQA